MPFEETGGGFKRMEEFDVVAAKIKPNDKGDTDTTHFIARANKKIMEKGNDTGGMKTVHGGD